MRRQTERKDTCAEMRQAQPLKIYAKQVLANGEQQSIPLSSEDILTTGHLYVSPSSVWLYFNSITTEDDL